MSNDNKSRIVGIDLGTTNSCISIVHNKTPKIIENNEGYRTTPSVVSIFKDRIVVGENAKKNLTTYPKNTIFASKRLIGRKYDDLDIKAYLRALPYDTVKHCNGDIWIKIDGKTYSPAQIGAFVLTKLKLAAEKVLNSKVVKSVITVPAYFNDIQRQATKDAGKIAGLDVLRVINEPTAAALAYGLDKSAQGTIVVYDLGGGTFDVSVLKLDDGIFHVLATNGNTFLGGEDVDNKLVDYILQKFQSKTGIDIGNEKASVNRIKEAVEKLKKELSCNLEAQINLPYICHVHGKNWHLEELITRDEFEKICRPIIEKTKEPCLRALNDAKVSKSDVKHVILAGGMTRIPYVRKVVRDVFGCEPMTDVNPDEVVAKGAALQAAVLEGQIDNVILLDVVPISLGIELLGGVYNKIINRNTTVPFKETHTFSTSEDNQTEVDIRVYQGENKMVNDNKLLGSIKLTNIPKAPKGVPRIEVTFEADVNGIYKVSACDAVTKEKQEISIVPSSGLNKEEIEHMTNEAKENEQRDKKLQQETEYKIKIKEMLNKNAYSSHITDNLKNIIQEPFDLEKAKSCLNEIEKKLEYVDDCETELI